jgi:hypothetical protein
MRSITNEKYYKSAVSLSRVVSGDVWGLSRGILRPQADKDNVAKKATTRKKSKDRRMVGA